MTRRLWAIALLGLLLPVSPPPKADPAIAEPEEFSTCLLCHDIAPNGVSLVGPPLWGVMGRRAGAVAGYPYSQALLSAGIVWDRQTLIRFVMAPQTVIPGTKMGYGGQQDLGIAAQIADYLLSLK